MTKLGPLGATHSALDTDTAVAVELEELGYSALWLAGGQGNNLPQITEVVRATSRIQVASGILSVDRVPSAAVASAYADLPAGRFVVGLGGAHGARPLAALGDYLDEIEDVVPPSARILSALGPRMLELARDRASGAYPYLVTTDYVASAREILGADRQLAVLLNVVADTDQAKVRETVRGGGSLKFLAGMPGYAANFRRMGFTDADIADLSDRLVDGLTVWGDFDAVVARLREYRAAGADQVVVPLDGLPREWWPELVKAL
ncbi:TIGR03620 family F420-dependent LLM class oxidoreductase [Amycolatopsis tolypomycina]|uniref:Probable F420-dependent oxidoreductase, MSMEG_4141 family n=1 Tax=Amycolatopsis tolypomycina TaxID=208445 RepID=A0A1H4S244_9PSEU|nr:TIGR03620 family F420-dependent LLM class oxidoreductase [Amycolatopsis tolypomycina]SEC38117.1 probable F420-dependent oxidoreductase, MSMEG_4141 family [Amycolatopsis tolypomycina]